MCFGWLLMLIDVVWAGAAAMSSEVVSVRRLALGVFGMQFRQLVLVDNMAVCLRANHSRAKDYRLLDAIRRSSLIVWPVIFWSRCVGLRLISTR